jgi:hypothetical protein
VILPAFTAALFEGGLLLWTQVSSGGMFARMSDAELVAKSEVIVQAELIGQTRVTLSPSEGALTLGILRIDEAFKGAKDESLLLLVMASPDRPRSSSDISYQKGQRGLWFLRSRAPGQGLYLADHPQRFVSATDGAALEAMRKTVKNLLQSK